ncbi:hypothetical protein [Hyalangium gracile]|nr:hypothetical protein [Hyalangium gracile]
MSRSPRGKTLKRLEHHAPRLERVKVCGGDNEKVVRKYDAVPRAG